MAVSIHGETLQEARGRRTIPTQTKGRVCEEEGCGTVLSIYNSGTKCARHAEPVTVSPRGHA